MKKVAVVDNVLLVPSPLGDIRLAAAEIADSRSQDNGQIALTGLHFVGQKYYPSDSDGLPAKGESLQFLRRVEKALEAYFLTGKDMQKFTLAPRGTPFQQSVWQGLLKLTSGQTITYGQLANRIGNAAAVRAAAAAVGRNPISLIIPCHRIIGADGSLTGYAGGLERKSRLLAIEKGAL